jgi:hypothetical protein
MLELEDKMRIIIAILCLILMSCSSYFEKERSNHFIHSSEPVPHYKVKIVLDSICSNNILKELINRYHEEFVITNCDSTDLYGRLILVEERKSYESWHGKDVPAPVGGGLLLILGTDCEIDTIYPQFQLNQIRSI